MEWYRDINDLLAGGCCLVLLVTCIICASFRHWHICRPCDKNPDYYYPARNSVCAFSLWHLLYLPFLLHPSSRNTIEYAASLELVIMTTMIPTILIKYFKPGGMARFRSSSLNYVVPLSIMGVAGFYTLLCPELQIFGSNLWFKVACGVIAFMMSLSLAGVLRWLRQRVDKYHLDEYSNEEDFPYTLAKKVLLAPWVVIGLCCIVFATDNIVIMSILWLLMSVLSVYYTITILYPHRPVIEPREDDASQESMVSDEVDAGAEGIDADMKTDALRMEVIDACRRRYLEPHLTRRDIISEFDYGQRTLVGKIISEYGFYNMINTLRLEHARLYAETHPAETKESVAINSGFKDRFALRHAQHKIGEGIADMLDGFKPIQY